MSKKEKLKKYPKCPNPICGKELPTISWIHYNEGKVAVMYCPHCLIVLGTQTGFMT